MTINLRILNFPVNNFRVQYLLFLNIEPFMDENDDQSIHVLDLSHNAPTPASALLQNKANDMQQTLNTDLIKPQSILDRYNVSKSA